MSNSLITEKALAESLKKLMLTTPVNKIHVRMITDDCGLTRHTFYNHFQDVYALLGWIYEHEVIEDLEKCCNQTGWERGIRLVLQYTVDNRTICLNTFRSLGRDHLESFLYHVFHRVMEGIIEDAARDRYMKGSLKSEIAEFYSNAVTGIFIAWLKQDLKKEPGLIAYGIEKMFEGSIERFMAEYGENEAFFTQNRAGV
ncbi:TetR/AcrR family transcriptional regulator C-terminal domain-containing protein [Lachnospiraceae bacterium 54-53]